MDAEASCIPNSRPNMMVPLLYASAFYFYHLLLALLDLINMVIVSISLSLLDISDYELAEVETSTEETYV